MGRKAGGRVYLSFVQELYGDSNCGGHLVRRRDQVVSWSREDRTELRERLSRRLITSEFFARASCRQVAVECVRLNKQFSGSRLQCIAKR